MNIFSNAIRAAAMAATVLFTACSAAPRYVARRSVKGSLGEFTFDKQIGMASYYADEFHGRPTSSGYPFDMNALTAAHRTLPLGTIVKVTNVENGRDVELLVNDRGPFLKGRVIDLSKAAAEKIGLVEKGTALVEIEIVKLPAK